MKLLSFCSGCGALDYGINSVIKAEIVLKCELDKKIQETNRIRVSLNRIGYEYS